MNIKNRTVVFDAQSVRFEEWNGHLRVAETNLTKANVCEYWGCEIANNEKYGFQKDKKYRFLRSPDALEKAVKSFAERPILYVHKAADADKLDNAKVIGTTGSDPSFVFPYIKDAITIWDGDYIEAIKNNTQAELSASYAFTPVVESGVFEGEPYDAIMTDIYVDHIALVEQGRAGPDVRVADSKHKPIHFKGKEMAKLNAVGKRIFTEIVNVMNNGRANDSNAKDIVSVISKATKTTKEMMPKVVSSLLIGHSMANDEDSDRIEETVKKAMDEDTDCKAKDADDPVDTLEADDEDEDGKDKKPKADDEDENNSEPRQEAEENRASDAALKEINRYKKEVQEAREAEKLVRPLVGELSIVSDSASEYYETAIKIVTGSAPPKGMPVSALKFMVGNLTPQKQQSQSRASDSKAQSTSEKARLGATRLRRP
ncbi:DUF2213 domain-containing protein [Commensalibacter communis]|uniref:DUF2213 domain-containing protein n=1 Tax=Commensalibacter communis TaxID=2972786 RepID=UPI0022FFC053|nr:DUF2213 domain-containing protein [Commensalibacter communis]CAI3933549.1 DUF2213 domain (PUBMED:21183074) [Commensalibacter communis]CAI3944657.1 DUF2213 domain (PUBMED:21183074) [Commensalibacter communis]